MFNRGFVKNQIVISAVDAPPLIEQLEGRRLMSASLRCGVLVVHGTQGDDEITVERNEHNRHKIDVTVNDKTRTFRANRIHGILVKGLRGDDVIEIDDKIKTRATLIGGRGDDEMVGGAGRDLLIGGLGDDDLDGGKGKDRVFSGEGQNVFQSSDSLKEMRDRDEDDGIRIRLNEAPSAVRSAVLGLLAGNDFRNLLRETDEGQTVFELEWDAPGPHSAKINLAGEVIELEVEIEISALPAAVVAAIAAKYPAGEITEAETLELPNTPLRYEVEVENDGLVRELVITPAGEILADHVEGVIEE